MSVFVNKAHSNSQSEVYKPDPLTTELLHDKHTNNLTKHL